MSDGKKNEISQRRQFAFRINVFFFVIFALFSVLIIRLAWLQFVEGHNYQALKNTLSSKTYETPPIRGNIYDREGHPIAYSTSTQSLFFRIEPGQSKDEVIALAKKLEEVFRLYGNPNASPLTADDIIKLMDVGYDLEKKPRVIELTLSMPRRIKYDLTEREVAYFLEHRDEYSGIEIVEESVRNYDENTIAVQLIGYLRQFSVARDRLDYYQRKYEEGAGYLEFEYVGMDGLEFMYQEELRGKNGSKTYSVNALGQIVGEASVTPPMKGNNLYLTIDKDVQLAAEEAILNHLEFMRSPQVVSNPYWSYKDGRRATTGYAVAMEVETGKVIAMASMPDYDPKIWNGGRFITPKDYQENAIFLKNGAISEAYAAHQDPEERAKHPSSLVYLGSTIKPLTVLIGLNEGLFNLNTVYSDRGAFYFGRDGRIQNDNGRAYGAVTVQEALRRSSNTFMAEMVGNRLFMREFNNGDASRAIDIWDSYMEQFGLGVSTGSGLPNETKGIKDYLNIEQAGSEQAALVYASFGQQGKYTTLQLAQYAAMLANKGKRMKPQFVERIETYDGHVVKTFEPEILNEVDFPEAYWTMVHNAMKQVFKMGFDDAPYTVAAKTGTSQQSVAGKLVNNAVFIAFAPAEKPKLAVAVIVPEGGYGAWGAAPIARAIFDAYDQQIGLGEEHGSAGK